MWRKIPAGMCLCLAYALCVHAANSTYYLDATGGNDGATGTSPSTAWRNLSKVNSTTFGPGDTILLKAGSVWSGSLSPRGSGADGSPNVIDTFSTGARPIINGNGAVSNTFSLSNQQYWEINNLELTNDDNMSVEDEGAQRSGVKISASSGVIRHIHVKNCYIHDVDGSAMNSKSTGGIIMPISGGAYFDGVLLANNTIRKVDRTGICATPGGTAATRNMVIRGNSIISAGGDAMIVQGSYKPLVEYNIADACCARCGDMCNAGIWPWATDSALFQFNEARNTVGGGCDRSGFDCDWKCRGTVFQYNYSHDNGGGFMLICSPGEAAGDYNFGSVIRYNISLDDRYIIFDLKGPATQGTQIYNNTIYVNKLAATTNIVADGFWGGPSGTAYFRNNIFYVLSDNASFGSNPNYTFDNNCYYMPNSARLDPARHTNALMADPMFADAGAVEEGIHSLDGYKLQANSSCINRGMDLRTVGLNPGTRDYYDNPIPHGQSFDIGCHEYSDPFKPVGLIVSPADRQRIAPAPATVDITVDAWYPGGGTISAVAFYEGGNRLAEDTDGSDGWSYAWSDVAKGTYTLTARIIGSQDEYSTTAPVEIIVGYRDPETVANTEPGFAFKYYEKPDSAPQWDSIPDFSTLTPVKTGICDGFSLSVRDRLEHIGIQYTGYLVAPADGVYTIWLQSDDGSNLYIGDELLVANDGLRGSSEEMSTQIALEAGTHAIRLDYFNAESMLDLLVRWQCESAGITTKQRIPAGNLVHGGKIARGEQGLPGRDLSFGLRVANTPRSHLVRYTIPSGLSHEDLRIRVVDHHGRTVHTLARGPALPGCHSVVLERSGWDPVPGHYFCVMTAGEMEAVEAVAATR